MPEETRKRSGSGKLIYQLISDVENKEFYRALLTKLYLSFCSRIGGVRAKLLLQQLKGKYLNICNLEGFFTYRKPHEDMGAYCYEEDIELEQFLIKATEEYKAFFDLRLTKVESYTFLIFLAYLFKEDKCTLSEEELEKLLEWFLISISSVERISPFYFVVISEYDFMATCKRLNIEVKFEDYSKVVLIFNKVIKKVEGYKRFKIPDLFIKVSVEFEATKKKEEFLRKVFDITYIDKNVLEDLLVGDYEQYKLHLEYLKENSINKKEIDMNKISECLQTTNEYYPNILYKVNPLIDGEGIKKRFFLKKSEPENLVDPVLSETEIDCSKIKNRETLEMVMQNAYLVNHMKKSKDRVAPKGKGLIRVILRNVAGKEWFLQEVNEQKERLRSLNMETSDTQVEIPSMCEYLTVDSSPDYIRIISDIHCDVNARRGYTFDFGDDFVINCGDTSGGCIDTEDWIKKNMKYGVFVTGNHLGYEHPFSSEDKDFEYKNTIEGQMEYLEKAFENSNVYYLNNKVIRYKGLVIIGTPLYTNFELYGAPHMGECIGYAKKGLNDYNYCTSYVTRKYTVDQRGRIIPRALDEPQITRTTPYIHRGMCYENLLFLTKALEKYKDEPVIVVTHHAPTKYSIGEKYKGDRLNPCFANNLKPIFDKYSNIRIWAHGHIHDSSNYLINGKTLVICEPFGYYTEQESMKSSLPDKYGKRISVDTILNKGRWNSFISGIPNFNL